MDYGLDHVGGRKSLETHHLNCICSQVVLACVRDLSIVIASYN